MSPAQASERRPYSGAALDRSFDPVATRRTFEEAVEQIAEKIRGGDLHTGDRLPSERELAAQMRISRPTLREAIKMLAAESSCKLGSCFDIARRNACSFAKSTSA